MYITGLNATRKPGHSYVIYLLCVCLYVGLIYSDTHAGDILSMSYLHIIPYLKYRYKMTDDSLYKHKEDVLSHFTSMLSLINMTILQSTIYHAVYGSTVLICIVHVYGITLTISIIVNSV